MRYHYIIPSLLSSLAFIWIYIAITEYGLWNDGPQGGFMPTLAASILLIFSVVTLCSKQNKQITIRLNEFTPVIFIITLIGVTQVLGLITAIVFMMFLWLRVMAKYPWRFSSITASSVAAVIWLIFVKWLNVPFPTGLF
jgi:hypothetical protein